MGYKEASTWAVSHFLIQKALGYYSGLFPFRIIFCGGKRMKELMGKYRITKGRWYSNPHAVLWMEQDDFIIKILSWNTEILNV